MHYKSRSIDSSSLGLTSTGKKIDRLVEARLEIVMLDLLIIRARSLGFLIPMSFSTRPSHSSNRQDSFSKSRLRNNKTKKWETCSLNSNPGYLCLVKRRRTKKASRKIDPGPSLSLWCHWSLKLSTFYEEDFSKGPWCEQAPKKINDKARVTLFVHGPCRGLFGQFWSFW